MTSKGWNDLLQWVGVGILIEGLIGYAMLKIAPIDEVIDAFLLILFITIVFGFLMFAFMSKKHDDIVIRE